MISKSTDGASAQLELHRSAQFLVNEAAVTRQADTSLPTPGSALVAQRLLPATKLNRPSLTIRRRISSTQGRIEGLFLGFVVLNIAVVLPALLFTPGFSMANKLIGALALVAFGVCLWAGTSWRRFPIALDVAWALSLFLLLREFANPVAALGVIYVGLYVRGLNGSLPQLIAVVSVLAVIFGFATLSAPGTPFFQIGNAIGFLGTAIVARAIGLSLEAGERMLHARSAMATVTDELIASADEAALVQNIESAVLNIAPDVTQVVVRLVEDATPAETSGWSNVTINAGGVVVGMISVNSTEQQPMVENLAATVGLCLEKLILEKKLRAESAAKSQFLAAMSHELRTPLNSVLGYSELIETIAPEGLTEKQLRYIHNIHTSGEHLLTLIGDILDLAKVAANEISLKLELLATREVVDRALAKVRPLADAKSLRLQSSVQEGTVYADSIRLEQVLLNLLGNAVKFTPNGGSISVHADELDNMVAISVVDTGVGIAPADQETIFDTFVQAEAGRTRGTDGAGLGLSLAKRMVELMQGRISVTSTPGKGSIFIAHLPATGVRALAEAGAA